MRLIESKRRPPKENWFVLAGALGCDPPTLTGFWEDAHTRMSSATGHDALHSVLKTRAENYWNAPKRQTVAVRWPSLSLHVLGEFARSECCIKSPILEHIIVAVDPAFSFGYCEFPLPDVLHVCRSREVGDGVCHDDTEVLFGHTRRGLSFNLRERHVRDSSILHVDVED